MSSPAPCRGMISSSSTPPRISSNVVYFNAMSHDILVVVTPDPASITDSYAMVKVPSTKTGRKDFNIVVNMVREEKEALELFRRLSASPTGFSMYTSITSVTYLSISM